MEKEKNKIKIYIPSHLENLKFIRTLVRLYLKEHKVSTKDEVQLVSVVDELATNAIEHGYNYNHGEVKLVLNIFEKTFFLTVEDFGKGYDESSISKEDGGIGLFIAKKLVDVFEVKKKTKGTIIKVEKKIREAV